VKLARREVSLQSAGRMDERRPSQPAVLLPLDPLGQTGQAEIVLASHVPATPFTFRSSAVTTHGTVTAAAGTSHSAAGWPRRPVRSGCGRRTTASRTRGPAANGVRRQPLPARGRHQLLVPVSLETEGRCGTVGQQQVLFLPGHQPQLGIGAQAGTDRASGHGPNWNRSAAGSRPGCTAPRPPPGSTPAQAAGDGHRPAGSIRPTGPSPGSSTPARRRPRGEPAAMGQAQLEGRVTQHRHHASHGQAQ
jgi:hypothetical protein